MPENTHGRAGESCSGLELLLEFLPQLVAQSRVQSTAILRGDVTDGEVIRTIVHAGPNRHALSP